MKMYVLYIYIYTIHCFAGGQRKHSLGLMPPSKDGGFTSSQIQILKSVGMMKFPIYGKSSSCSKPPTRWYIKLTMIGFDSGRIYRIVGNHIETIKKWCFLCGCRFLMISLEPIQWFSTSANWKVDREGFLWSDRFAASAPGPPCFVKAVGARKTQLPHGSKRYLTLQMIAVTPQSHFLRSYGWIQHGLPFGPPFDMLVPASLHHASTHHPREMSEAMAPGSFGGFHQQTILRRSAPWALGHNDGHCPWLISTSPPELVGGIPSPLKNMSQLGWWHPHTFPIYGKITNVPNHQPVMIWRIRNAVHEDEEKQPEPQLKQKLSRNDKTHLRMIDQIWNSRF